MTTNQTIEALLFHYMISNYTRKANKDIVVQDVYENFGVAKATGYKVWMEALEHLNAI